MSRTYFVCELPKYEKVIPANAKSVYGETVILWECYIDHRDSTPVYLSSVNGHMCMLKESDIVPGSVRTIKRK